MIIKGFRFGMLLQFAVGPVCLFIFQTAAVKGFFSAETGAFGVTLIDGLYILMAIHGIGSLLNKSENLKVMIMILGSVVLIIFGMSQVLNAFNLNILPSLRLFTQEKNNHIFLQSLFLTLSNPLTIIFWAGVFASNLTETDMKKRDMYLFGTGAVLSTLLFLTAIALTGHYLRLLLISETVQILNIIVGLIFVLSGLKSFIRMNVFHDDG